MNLTIAPEALREAATGSPSVLVMEGVAAAEALALPGLALWRVVPAETGFRLQQPGEQASAPPLPLPAMPAGVLAVIAPDAAMAAPLLAAWEPPPPLITAADAAAALPPLARIAAAELSGRMAEAARLQRALAALREEAEETRAAMAALVQGVGHHPPPPPILVLSAEPGGGAVGAERGRLALGQRLGVTLEGVAALALHVAEARLAPGAWLRVRLYGAESGRVRGVWLLPAEAITPGWLVLDLPTPLGPVRESACLDIQAETGAEDRLTLSLEDAEAPPDRAVVVEEGTSPGRALALRLWIAPFGRRFVLAPHWDWEAPETLLGVPLRLPEQVWAAARLPEGRGGRAGVGDGPVRPVITLGGGERALLLLPVVPVTGLDLLEAELAVRLGEASALEAALWTQPAGAAVTTETALSLTAPGARCTGWHRVDAARGGLSLALRLPAGGPDAVAVALVLHNRAAQPEQALRLEWLDLVGRRLVQPLPAPPPAARTRLPPSPTLAAVAPADAVPRVQAVRLHELYEMEGGGYRHLDIGAEALRLGGLAWPRIRFKFAINGEAPQIEIRARPDWPALFERWPGNQADEHGPFFVLTEADRAGRAAERLASERDRRLLDALLRLLPTMVATAARAATTDPVDYDTWVGMARRFAAALRPEEGTR